MHSKAEVPGEQQYLESKQQKTTNLRQNTQFKRSEDPEDSGNLSSLNNTSSKLLNKQPTTQKRGLIDPTKQKQQLTLERQQLESQETAALQEVIKDL